MRKSEKQDYYDVFLNGGKWFPQIIIKKADATKVEDKEVTNNKELDDEPKTGMVNYGIFTTIITILSIGGLAILKLEKQ